MKRVWQTERGILRAAWSQLKIPLAKRQLYVVHSNRDMDPSMSLIAISNFIYKSVICHNIKLHSHESLVEMWKPIFTKMKASNDLGRPVGTHPRRSEPRGYAFVSWPSWSGRVRLALHGYINNSVMWLTTGVVQLPVRQAGLWCNTQVSAQLLDTDICNAFFYSTWPPSFSPHDERRTTVTTE